MGTKILIGLACISIGIITGFISGYVFRRNVSADRPGGQGDCSASTRTGASLATTEEINFAVDRAIRSNQEAAAVIQKMRDMLGRLDSSTNCNSNDSGNQEID